MEVVSSETSGNGHEKNLIVCPHCGQKMFNMVSLEGNVELVVMCRRCRRFIKFRMSS